MNRWELCLCLAVAAHAQSSGTMAGKVVNAAGGGALPGVVVVLEGSEATGTPPQVDSYVVETGSDGRFQVDVAPGRYQVRPQREGFTVQPPHVAPAKAFPRVTVQAGQRVEAPTVRLIPLGAISGRVVDADGDPVSARVEALRYVYANGTKELKAVGYALANDRGEYRIFDLPPGQYYLRAPHNGKPMGMKVRGSSPVAARATTYFPSVTDRAAAVSLDLAPGAELRDNTIQLHVETTYSVRVKLARVAGSAPNPAAHPVISISYAEGGGTVGIGMSADWKDGWTVPFNDLAPGTYTLRAGDRDSGLCSRRVVKVTNADVDVTLAPTTEFNLSGSVRVESGGRMAAESVRVSLEVADPWDRFDAAMKPDGKFTIGCVQPEVYAVHVTVPSGGYLKSIHWGDRELATPHIDAAQSSRPLTISVAGDGGTVNGAADEEGAVIVLVPSGRLSDWSDLIRSTTAGRDGKFELRDIAPGDYRLYVFDDAELGAPMDPDFRRPFEKQSVAVRVAANSHQTLQVKSISVSPAQ